VGVAVYWSVDPNGHLVRSPDGTTDEAYQHVIVDSDGVEWAVREVATPQIWARADHCLVLNSRDCVRRVWSYPADWRRLGADALLEMGLGLGRRSRETRRVRKT